MSSGNVLKGRIGYSYEDENARVIDSNGIIAARIEMLSEIMRKESEKASDFQEEFSLGLNAEQVGALLSDSDDMDESEGNVIKAAPTVGAVDVDALLSDAQQQADEIINDANLQAESILARAQEEAEAIRNQAMEDGRQEGYNAGYEDAEHQFDVKLQELAMKEASLQEEFERSIEELEPKFVDTLIDIFDYVLHVRLSDDKDLIKLLLQDAIRKIDADKSFIIHVSKDDYASILSEKEGLLSGIPSSVNAEIIEDITLRHNECFIETGGGIFDCSLETQLSGLKKELTLLSYTKND